jgi:hypothetical protein
MRVASPPFSPPRHYHHRVSLGGYQWACLSLTCSALLEMGDPHACTYAPFPRRCAGLIARVFDVSRLDFLLTRPHILFRAGRALTLIVLVWLHLPSRDDASNVRVRAHHVRFLLTVPTTFCFPLCRRRAEHSRPRMHVRTLLCADKHAAAHRSPRHTPHLHTTLRESMSQL